MPEAVKETVAEKVNDDIEKVPCKEVSQVEAAVEKAEEAVESSVVEKNTTESSEKTTVEGNGTAMKTEESTKEKSTNGTATPKESTEATSQDTKSSEADKDMTDNSVKAENCQKSEEKPAECAMDITQNEPEKTSELPPNTSSTEAATEKPSSEAGVEKTSVEAPVDASAQPAPVETVGDSKSENLPTSKEGDVQTPTQGEPKADAKAEEATNSQVGDKMDTDETPKGTEEKTDIENDKTSKMEVEEMETDAPAKPVNGTSDAMEINQSAKSEENTSKTNDTKTPESTEAQNKTESSDVGGMEVEGTSSDSKDLSDAPQASEPKNVDTTEMSSDISKNTVVDKEQGATKEKSSNASDVSTNDIQEKSSTDNSPSVETSCEKKSECPGETIDNSSSDQNKKEIVANEEKPVDSKEETSNSDNASKEEKHDDKTNEMKVEETNKEDVKEQTQDATKSEVATEISGSSADASAKSEEENEKRPMSSKELTALINPPYKPPQVPKDQESSNLTDSGAGGSREIDPKIVKEIKTLMLKGQCLMKSNDYFAAADTLGKACEIAGKLYGDLAVENAELFYLYGCAMLECAKNENPVLGEGVKDQEEAEEDDTTEGNDTVTNDEEEQMEVENGEAAETESKDKEEAESTDKEEAEDGGEEEDAGETTKEEEDDDSSLKVAWDMFELAKHLFQKLGNDLRLSDTYIKLGEVGVESGHSSAIEDMKNALDIRKKCASDNERLLAETHFHIGLAYATFQYFDEAIESFKVSKSIIQAKLDRLKEESSAEIKELSELIPDLDDKIQDMEDSKKVKATAVEGLVKENGGAAQAEAPESAGTSNSKEVSNISHLVKRKRKLEEVASDLLPNSKQPCTESVSEKESESAPMDAE